MTGPDEYTAIVDNNVYTNLMAQRNLREAAEAVERRPDVAAAGWRSGPAEVEAWLRAADWMAVPYDTQRGVHMQSDAFTHHEEWDFEGTARTSTRCCCTTRTSRSTASRWSSRPTW